MLGAVPEGFPGRELEEYVEDKDFMKHHPGWEVNVIQLSHEVK